ncbi:hypothetical protein M9458_038905, partial [Cirrhinus mrigala]
GLDSVEYYEIGSNEWKMASPMPWRGVTVKCAAVGSVIYVLAGFQGVGRLGHIMEYYTETDKWVVSSKLPHLSGGHVRRQRRGHEFTVFIILIIIGRWKNVALPSEHMDDIKPLETTDQRTD